MKGLGPKGAELVSRNLKQLTTLDISGNSIDEKGA